MAKTGRPRTNFRYEKIATDIREKIEIGDYTDKLPTYRDLVVVYNANYSTIYTAMQMLRAQGWITTSYRGSFVNKKRS